MGRRDELRATFDSVAQVYDAARPAYPAGLFEDLADLASLRAGAWCVEVGCGTGQATRSLLEHGWNVVAVEPGQGLARLAAGRLAHPGLQIEVQDFEQWVPPRAFDAVFAATSWHWVDPEDRCAKAASALGPSGSLAVVTTDHVVAADGDPFFIDVHEIYRQIGEDGGDGPPAAPEDVPVALESEFAASGAFDHPAVRRYVWSTTYTTEQYIHLLSTYSNHIAMEDARRARLYGWIESYLDRRAHPVRKDYLNTLYVARRVAQVP